jgi:hypothetical protein
MQPGLKAGRYPSSQAATGTRPSGQPPSTGAMHGRIYAPADITQACPEWQVVSPHDWLASDAASSAGGTSCPASADDTTSPSASPATSPVPVAPPEPTPASPVAPAVLVAPPVSVAASVCEPPVPPEEASGSFCDDLPQAPDHPTNRKAAQMAKPRAPQCLEMPRTPILSCRLMSRTIQQHTCHPLLKLFSWPNLGCQPQNGRACVHRSRQRRPLALRILIGGRENLPTELG